MIGSLFSGIGGLELGLERAGLGSVAWQVERSAFCRHILARHWPDAIRYDDVRTVGRDNLAPVDVLCGGFPCQDVSTAGKGAGLAGARSGLWYEMERVIDELRPTWVVVENISHGWRRYVPVVRLALWRLGYASLPIRVRACDVGARHERARVFVVAGPHADIERVRLARSLGGVGATPGGWDVAGHGSPAQEPAADADSFGGRARATGRAPAHDEVWAREGGDAADADGETVREQRRPANWGGEAVELAADAANVDRLGRNEGATVLRAGESESAGSVGAEGGAGHVAPGFGLAPRPWMVRGVHGLPGGVDGPWKRAGWTGARVRTARIHALGNSVVPACAEVVGRLIVGARSAA